MKNQQVITIRADGTIEGLQHKAGKGLDLKSFGRDNSGKADIERVSLIEWDSVEQAWYVLFIATHTEIDDSVLTHEMWQALIGETDIKGARSAAGYYDRPVMFEEYEDGVSAEIAYLNALRLTGKM